MRNAILLFTLFAFTLAAADFTGTWKGTAEGPNGTLERTFVFKQDGNKLTGKTVSNMFGESAIQNGKVDGESISFTITVKFQDNEMQVNYKGKLQGDVLKMTAEAGGNSFEWTAKRGS